MECLVILKKSVLTLGSRTRQHDYDVGRIGDKYLKLSPGASEVVLGLGITIIET